MAGWFEGESSVAILVMCNKCNRIKKLRFKPFRMPKSDDEGCSSFVEEHGREKYSVTSARVMEESEFALKFWSVTVDQVSKAKHLIQN